MLSFITASIALSAAVVSAASTTVPHTATDTAAIAKELATDVPNSPTSHVKGKVFDRFVTIMMENTDFAIADSDRRLHFPEFEENTNIWQPTWPALLPLVSL